jgi:hypothetical protein
MMRPFAEPASKGEKARRVIHEEHQLADQDEILGLRLSLLGENLVSRYAEELDRMPRTSPLASGWMASGKLVEKRIQAEYRLPGTKAPCASRGGRCSSTRNSAPTQPCAQGCTLRNATRRPPWSWIWLPALLTPRVVPRCPAPLHRDRYRWSNYRSCCISTVSSISLCRASKGARHHKYAANAWERWLLSHKSFLMSAIIEVTADQADSRQ